jgi:hypothetical protein
MFENATDSHASDSGVAGREGRTILGAKAKPLYSQMALSRKPFGIGHVHIKFFFFFYRYNDLPKYLPFLLGHSVYHPDPWHAPVAATTVFSIPDDGRRKRPKHVE